MSDDRLATVRPIPEEEADPRVSAVYDDIRRTKNLDFVPNFWRTLATNPDLLESVWTNLKQRMHPEQSGSPSSLDARTREIIALAVSVTNGCDYCINSHTAALIKLGVDPPLLGEIMSIIGLFNLTNVLAEGYQVRPDILPPQP